MPFLLNFVHTPGQQRQSAIIRATLAALRTGAMLAALLATLLALGGCTALRLSYNNAGTLAYWWLDGFADFDSAQSQRVRTDLADLARWHRQDELPLVAELLQGAQALAQQQPEATQICALYQRSVLRMQALAQRALPGAAALAPTLQASQLSHLAAKYEKNNHKWREEWLSTDTDSLARRTQKIRERLEDFYGPLTPAQVRQLQLRMEASGLDEALHYRELLRRQQETLRTLERLRGTSPSTAQAALSQLMNEYFQSSDPAYRAYRDRSVAQTCEAMAQLHASATPQQRKNLLRKLQSYLQDVRALMAQSV